MNNLSTREKVLIYVVILCLLIGIVYVAVIRPLENSIAKETAKLNERKATYQYYEELRASNTETKKNIQETENKIKKQEASLFAHVDGEIVENYLMQVFEKNGSKYLSKFEVEDIVGDDIYYPDGTIANEHLIIKRVKVEYATTDGYTLPEYNNDPKWAVDGHYDMELIEAALVTMGDTPVVGYNEFVSSLKELSEAYPTCVKIHRATVEDSTMGFCFLRAEVDFYATELGSSRILPVNDKSQISIDWTGRTGVDCSGGMVGVPLCNFNDKNSFFMYQIPAETIKEFTNRPYCSYFSSAILSENANLFAYIYEDPTNKVVPDLFIDLSNMNEDEHQFGQPGGSSSDDTDNDVDG